MSRTLQQVYDAWMRVVAAFSWLLARVASTVVFVVGFIPYGLVMRLIGFDPLERSFDDRESYWTGVGKESHCETLDDFRRQY